jgi:hypothetical protein
MGVETARRNELLLGAKPRPALEGGNAVKDLFRFALSSRLLPFLRAHRIEVARAKQHQPRYPLRMLNRVERRFHLGAL